MNQDRYTSSLDYCQVRHVISHLVKNTHAHNITNCRKLEHSFLIVYTVTCDHHIEEPK